MSSHDGPDPANPAEFRQVLGRVPTSVAVISASVDGAPVGVSVGSFTSVSLEPPLVGFFIALSSTTWPRIEATGGFCASILSSSHEEVSRLFATPGADRFGGSSWHVGAHGRPVITGSVASFDCDIESTVACGDHSLVLGRVQAMESREPAGACHPLLFWAGRYAAAAPIGEASSDWGARR